MRKQKVARNKKLIETKAKDKKVNPELLDRRACPASPEQSRREQVRRTQKAPLSINLRQPVKTAAVTATGAGVGVIGAIAGVTVAAVFEVALPVGLCLWAGGVTFGAIGLALRLGKKKKSE